MLGKLLENRVRRFESLFVLLYLVEFLPHTRPDEAPSESGCARGTHALTHWVCQRGCGHICNRYTHHDSLEDGRLLLGEDLAIFRGHLAEAGD
jgi:hypothetical protein